MPSVATSYDLLVEFDGIRGSVTAPGYEHWCEVVDYELILNGGTAQDLVIIKPVDDASPVLWKLACTSDNIPKATLHKQKKDRYGDEYVRQEHLFKNLRVVSVRQIPGSFPLHEVISLAFGSADYSYRTLDASGYPGAWVTRTITPASVQRSPSELAYDVLRHVNAAEIPGRSIYTKIGNVQGECDDMPHTGWIETDNFGFAILNEQGRAGGRSIPAFQEVVIVKELDKASPPLFELAATAGPVQGQVAIELTRLRFGEEEVFLEVKLTGVRIDSIQALADDKERVALSFDTIEWTYTLDGGGTTKFGWDLERNAQK